MEEKKGTWGCIGAALIALTGIGIVIYSVGGCSKALVQEIAQGGDIWIWLVFIFIPVVAVLIISTITEAKKDKERRDANNTPEF